jgi:hypothetical protein
MKAQGEGPDYKNTYYVLGEETSFYKVSGDIVSNVSRKEKVKLIMIKLR